MGLGETKAFYGLSFIHLANGGVPVNLRRIVGWPKEGKMKRFASYQTVLIITIVFFIILSFLVIGIVEIPEVRNKVFQNERYAYSVDISPDGQEIAVAGQNNNVKIYDFDSGNFIRDLKVNNDLDSNIFYYVQWSPDGERIATYNWPYGSAELHIWDKTGEHLQTFNIEGRWLSTENFVWSPTSDEIACAIDTRIIIINIANGTERTLSYTTSTEFEANIRYWDWSFDGKYIAFSNGLDGYIIDSLTGEELYSLNENSYIWGLKWKSNENVLVYVRNDQIKLWDLTSNSIRTISGQHGEIYSFEWSSDSSKVIISTAWFDQGYGFEVLSSNNFSILYKQTLEKQNILPSRSNALSLKWSPDDRYILSTTRDGSIFVWDSETGDFIKSIPTYNLYQNSLIFVSLAVFLSFVILLFKRKGYGLISMLIGAILMLNAIFIESADTTIRYSTFWLIFLTGLITYIFGTCTNPKCKSFRDKNIKIPKIVRNYILPSVLILSLCYLTYYHIFHISSTAGTLLDRNPVVWGEAYYSWHLVLIVFGLILPVLPLIVIRNNNEFYSNYTWSFWKISIITFFFGSVLAMPFIIINSNKYNYYNILLILFSFVLIPTISSLMASLNRKTSDSDYQEKKVHLIYQIGFRGIQLLFLSFACLLWIFLFLAMLSSDG